MNHSTKIITWMVIFLLSAWVAAQKTNSKSEVKQEKIGKTINVHSCGILFLAGQPSEADFKLMAERNIKRIITLRTDGEVAWNEQEVVKDAGLEYVEMPFRSPDALTDEFFQKIRTELASNKSTMLHCGSANRVGAVWLPYRVLDQGVKLEDALVEAKEVGLRSPALLAKAVAYIESEQKKIAEVKSVKPGINDRFLDPNLKIEEWVDRFEVESREVFSSRDEIVAMCKIKPGMTVADIGAGTGLFTREFAKAVGSNGRVLAVDISKTFLEHIETSAKKFDLENIETVLAKSNSAELPENSVDVAFICDTYHHFEFPNATMNSIQRALKPNGRLVLIDFERIPGKTREWLMNHVRAGKDVFRQEVESAGFKFVAEEKVKGFQENYFLTFTKKQ